MSEYYDRNGEPMTRGAYLKAAADKRVARTMLPDGKVVSTIWLGLDHSFGYGSPLIFETILFPADGDYSDMDQNCYTTEAEALAGHLAMVAKYSRGETEGQ